jgi:hypothetical protein
MIPRKTVMNEIELKHVALNFCEISVRIVLMQQQQTPFLIHAGRSLGYCMKIDLKEIVYEHVD